MSNSLTLVIANKNYSSWSLRPWLLLRQFGIAFDEIKLPLDTPEFYTRIAGYSPAGRVPVLVDGDLHIWDSLAICEYVNERYLDGRAWPSDPAQRARARSVSAEMHSGFSMMCEALPMNCRKHTATPALGPGVAHDIARIRSIWRDARAQNSDRGEFLFGAFGIADAMYAPVVFRFVSYAIELDPVERAYVATMLALPVLHDWLSDAATEPLAALHEQSVP